MSPATSSCRSTKPGDIVVVDRVGSSVWDKLLYNNDGSPGFVGWRAALSVNDLALVISVGHRHAFIFVNSVIGFIDLIGTRKAF